MARVGAVRDVKDKLNEELLAFFKALTVNARYDRDLVETPLPMTGLRRPVCYGTCEQGTAERIFMENLSPKDAFFSLIVCEAKNIREWTANRSAQPVATNRAVMKRDSPSAALRPAASSSSNSPSPARRWPWDLNSLASHQQTQLRKPHPLAQKMP